MSLVQSRYHTLHRRFFIDSNTTLYSEVNMTKRYKRLSICFAGTIQAEKDTGVEETNVM